MSYLPSMKSILFAICLLWIHVSFAQSTYIIYLQDKDLKEQNLVQITDRSLERRRRNSVQNDVHDIPLNSEQVSELSKFGRVIKKSRWLNAIVLESDHDLEDQLSSISFVKGFEKIEKSVGSSKNKFEDELNLKSFNYGRADTQIRQLGLDCVHASGHLGSGVFLAFLDAGYNGMDTISYFDRLYVELSLIHI